MIDMNSYFVMSLNRDASVSVIDPVVGITGITSLYANIRLKRPGADWAKTASEQWLYVTMPRAGEVALVNLENFKVDGHIAAGEGPTRVALQPDEKYLWVGNNARAGTSGGVTVIDTQSRQAVATIQTGSGHHEIAFSDDSRYVFVSNRDGGTVSVIDAAAMKKVRDIETGGTPISLAVSQLSRSLYIADGQTGVITVVDRTSLEIAARITTKSGLGPMRFSEDGRWGVAVNPVANEVYVIDAATNQVAQTVPVTGRPFQVSVSPAFAYVRALDSERVSMINLTELGKGGKAIVSSFAAGSFPPSQASDISIADAIAPAVNEAAVLVVSPGDATVYYYMEGMNAPMGAFRNYGHAPRAVLIANRALKEKQPGVYASTVRIPAAGSFDIAFLNEAPRFLHCFSFKAEINPLVKRDKKGLEVDYLFAERSVSAGKALTMRFRLSDAATGRPRADVQDVRVLYFRAPMYGRTVAPAHHIGEGVYETTLSMNTPGAYYVYVGAPSEDVKYEDLNYLTLTVVRKNDS
jgi:YVTN family beta-propeller protein